MNVTQMSLEALISKATNESLPCPDPAALEAFCIVMQHLPNGPQMAAQILAVRIHLPHTQKAMLALSMTDLCMRKCGPEFHAEIGKFRFLNEMIKLVSPKYLADVTAPEVRNRVLELLNDWSINFPREAKFKVAYDMLKNQGVVTENPPSLPPNEVAPPKLRTKNPVQDVEKTKILQKLLQSKKPEDIQHANRLIKNMVREEERRIKASSRREQELSRALDSAGLLSDMLDSADSASVEEIQLIHELYFIIAKTRIMLDDMATHTNDSEYLGDILRANDILNEIHAKYEEFVKQTKKPSTSNRESLLDFAGASPGSASNAAEFEPKRVARNAMDELGDIFSTKSESHIAAPLQPVNLMKNGDKAKSEGWNELDSLGEQLLKQSLPENAKRVDSFNGNAKKIPMNALPSPKHEASLKTSPVFDLDFFITKPTDYNPLGVEATEPIPVASNVPMTLNIPVTSNSSVTSNDDVMVDISKAPSLPTNCNNILDLSPLFSNEPNLNGRIEVTPLPDTDFSFLKINSKFSKAVVKPLTDITVTLDSVQPSNVPPLTAFEGNGVTIVLHFCKDRPRPDVNVVVVSTTSRNGMPIEDYNLHCVVPTGAKVRLLTASGTSLPAFNPFLPPPALTQVMLIARLPGSPPINLKFVITYTVDEDVYSEMGEVKQLPLDEIE